MPGYTFKGIYKELQKHLGSSVQNYIVAARTAQGYEEWSKSSREERLDVVSRWQQTQVELAKEKHQARHGNFHGPSGFLKTRHLSFDERKRLAEEKKSRKKNAKGQAADDMSLEASDAHASPSAPGLDNLPTVKHDDTDFEEAIKASVAATSKGNPDEDHMIEQALRASVTELQKASTEGDEQDAIQRAIQVAARVRAPAAKGSKQPDTGDDGADDHGKQLEEALQRSMTSENDHTQTGIDFDDSGIDTDDDENIKTALQKSLSQPSGTSKDVADDEFERAIDLSKQAHDEHQEGLHKSKTEEEVVLEYVKKQSLMEEQLKNAALRGDS